MQSENSNINEQIGRHLGKVSEYPKSYAPEVLTPVPRALNRDNLALDGVPMLGPDIWHAYEVSALLDSGLPIAAVLRLTYNCDTENLVESKSLKLYLNSFNMEKVAKARADAIRYLCQRIAIDVGKCVGGEVSVTEVVSRSIDDGYPMDSVLLEEACGEISISNYSENAELLVLEEHAEPQELAARSALLRSSCRITAQPDWGSTFIYMKGTKLPTLESLLAYIVSFRDEHHFHEEIVETLYSSLYKLAQPEELLVLARYTRRGGIDINPVRASGGEVLAKFDLKNFVFAVRQ